MRAIGITGGIACGKSTVGDYLAQKYGVPVLNADRYAKIVLDTEVKNEVVRHFGHSILQNDQIDRKVLADIIFTDPTERLWLERQIHPIVCQRLLQDAQQYQIVALEIPLLFEANMTHLVTEIWVVSCNEQKTIERLQARNQLSLAECQSRIAAQMPLAQKCALGDVLIENNGSLSELWTETDRAYNNFRRT